MPLFTDEKSVGQYLANIANSRPLSREREVELAALIQAGDEEARNELVKANLRFVIDVAKNYQNRGLPLADLISAGNIGLLTAAERFDGARGFKFISYAVWWIRQAIQQALAEQVRTVRLPINRLSVLRDITRATKKLQGESDQALDLEAVASELDLPIEEVESTLQDSHQSCSLDEAFSDDDERNLLDVLVDNTQSSPDAAVMTSSVIEVLRLELERLNEREQRIFRLYYGLDGQNPITLEKIGAELGVTRERVRQLKERALSKMRHPSNALPDECRTRTQAVAVESRAPESGVSSQGHGEAWTRMMQSHVFYKLNLKGPGDLKERLQASGGDVAALFRDNGRLPHGYGPTIQMVKRFALAAGFMVNGNHPVDSNSQASGNSQPTSSSAQHGRILDAYNFLLKELGERPTAKEVAYESNEPEEIVGIVLASHNLAT